MTIDNKIKQFFLGGTTEPVALEIPISTSNTYDEILHVLSENGLNVTADPTETDKILIDKKGIITPPLKPEDVIPIYEILEKALEEAKCNINATPHIVDLKSITPRLYIPKDLELEQQYIRSKHQNELIGDEKSFEEHMINEALASDKSIVLPWSHEANIPSEIFQGYNKGELLFSGSTISDPYRTATQRINRNVRMASSDLIDGIRYSHPESKTYCKYELYAGDQRYGFFHIYKTAPDQCYYGGVGIEIGGQPKYRGCSCEETMVNRFKNPCIAEYLAIKEIQGSQVYYRLFLIPQNDERWQDFKKLAIHPNNYHLFATRYNLLYEQRENPQAVIPLTAEAYDETGPKSDFTQKRIEKIRTELQRLRQEIESISKDVDELSKDGEKIAKSEISLEEKKSHFKKLEEQGKKKKEKILTLKKKISSSYNPVGNIAVLKEEIDNILDLCWKVKDLNFYQTISNLQKIEEDRRVLRQKNISYIYNCIENRKKIPDNLDLSFLQPEERNDMLRKTKNAAFSRNQAIDANIIENSLKLYTSAQSREEKQNLFEYMEAIRADLYLRDKRLASQLLKKIEHDVKFKEFPEIRHLFKNNNIFINHAAKARRIIYNLTPSKKRTD